jgi:hypothetical protein
MKKLLTLFVAMMLLSGAMGVGKAQAFTFEPGGNKLLIDGYSYLKQTNDSLWGIFSVGNVSQWFPTSNTIAGPVSPPYWSTPINGGEYLAIKFGNILNPMFNPQTNQVDWDVTTSFVQLYLLDFNAFSLVDNTKSDVLASAGDGTINSFGMNIASGTLLLDLKFDQFSTDLPEIKQNQTFIDANGFLSVTGGPLATIFDSNFFLDMFDAAITGTNVELPDPNIDWNYTSNQYSAYVNVVPEPGTLLLLGAGMLGLAACARKRRQN